MALGVAAAALGGTGGSSSGPGAGDDTGGLERATTGCARKLVESEAAARAPTRRAVKPCSELSTHLYYAEELFDDLDWKVEKIPRGVVLRSNVGLSYEFADLPKYFPDPVEALLSITTLQAWRARMRIDQYGRVSVARSPLGFESFLGQEIRHHLDFVLREYLRRKIVTPEEVEEFNEEEKGLNPLRTVYFTLTDRLTENEGHAGKAETVIRIYDGTPYPGYYRELLGLPLQGDPDGHILPLERQHPEVVAHLRKEHGPRSFLFELGRLAVSEELDYGLPAILREISRSFLLYRFRMNFQTLHESHFVMRATKAGARLYVAQYGMKLIDPDELLRSGAIDEKQAEALRKSPYRYLQSNAHDFMQAFLNAPGVH